MSTVLVTGAAGFIGYHVAKQLATEGHAVICIDTINDYYDTELKYARLRDLGISEIQEWNTSYTSDKFTNLLFQQLDIADANAVDQLFLQYKIEKIIHLAAQAGVRYSLQYPDKYVRANVVGYFNLLHQAKESNCQHFVYSSSSSVYGLNTKMPLAVSDNVDHPISLYAATKKSNELFAHAYSHLYQLPTTGLRFFTVYGPWGRPDMAYFKFTRAILAGHSIDVYNQGNMYRDFTYIDDIVEGIIQVLDHIPTGNPKWSSEQPDPSSSPAPYRIFNIGNHTPINLLDFIHLLETELGEKAKLNLMPIQPGDVYKTFADVNQLKNEIHYEPQTPLHVGIRYFVNWYKSFYGEQ